MSKHNYTQYSNKPKNNDVVPTETLNPVAPEVKTDAVPVVDQVVTPEAIEPAFMHETVETKAIPETVSGMVVGCAKLNVRAEASLFANIVCVLNAQSEIEIDVNKSDKDWFYICTATGIEGYCMRKFVEAHL